MIKYVSINNIGVIDLEDFIRILAIVPYEGMGTLLRRAAEEFPQLTVDIFEGNMEQAVQIANQHFPAGYDIVLSRGGTAQLLRSTGFPVVDVDISLYDTLCALKLCDGLIGKVALVAYANITINARILCELMQYNIDVYTLESVNDLDPKLQQLLHEGYSTVLCDMTAYNIARKLGLNSILITSGMESIRKALYQAESMLQYHRKLLEDNRFYLSALQTQRNTVIIENETKEIFLCTMEDIPSGLLDQLQNAVPDPGSPVPGHFTRQIQEGLFHITAFPLLRGSHAYTVFYLKKQVLPICSNQVGIRCSSPRDVEEYATQTLFSFSTLHPMLWNSLVEQARSCTPLLFCGERGTGKHIYSVAAAHGKRVQAQCEAKNHALVLEDCDLESATNAIINSTYGCAGMRCMALPVVVVQESIADRFVQLLKEKAMALKVGCAYDPETKLGPVVNAEHKKFICDWIQKGVDEGAELVLDGRDIVVPGYENGFFVGPTILDHVKPGMTVGDREIFGPVTVIKRVKTFEEGLAVMNANPFANGSVIFTQSGYYARQFEMLTDGGMVGINVGIPVPSAYFPFSGNKDSFFGDLHVLGQDGVRFYTRAKTVTKHWYSEHSRQKAVDTWEGTVERI